MPWLPSSLRVRGRKRASYAQLENLQWFVVHGDVQRAVCRAHVDAHGPRSPLHAWAYGSLWVTRTVLGARTISMIGQKLALTLDPWIPLIVLKVDLVWGGGDTVRVETG